MTKISNPKTIDFAFQGTPGRPGFKVSAKDHVAPSLVEHIETFVSGACRLNESLALAKHSVLDKAAPKTNYVIVGEGEGEITALVGFADRLGGIPGAKYQTVDVQYSSGQPEGVRAANAKELVHFSGSTAAGENWWRRTVNGSCDEGEVIRMNRERGTISLEALPAGYRFPFH